MTDLQHTNFRNIEECITAYFDEGHKYKSILYFLRTYHNTRISIQTLKRHIKSLGLSRYNVPAPDRNILLASLREIQEESGGAAGYRTSWRALQRRGIVLPQETVRQALLEINAGNVRVRTQNVLRRRMYQTPGPNFIWHIDGYDKLKNYGFAISGCIDGFSRKIIWLKSSVTNNDPEIILHYFLEALQTNEGCPKFVRSDCGTENTLVAAAQCMLRGQGSHIYGTSVHNQRIESYWATLRKMWTNAWITTFENLCNFGAFMPGNRVHKAVLVFTFSRLIERQLNEIRIDWNGHTLQRSRSAVCPSGKPNDLFFSPPEGYRDFKQEFDHLDFEYLRDRASQPTSVLDDHINRECLHLLNEYNLEFPSNRKEGVTLYFTLIQLLNALPNV